MIEVAVPGLYSSIQDRGRPGYYALGLPPSGALDMYAHDCANALVGNSPEAATIEATYLGPTLSFETETVVAVTGATADVTVDGEKLAPWTGHRVRPGQCMSFGAIGGGVRVYIAVRGGFDVQPVMGSRSTYSQSGIGGLKGRALRAGDRMSVGSAVRNGTRPREGLTVPESLRPTYREEQEIRVMPGLCDYRLTREAHEVLYSTPFSVTFESNRTGYRLKGEPLAFIERPAPFGAGHDPSNVVNLGYPIGSIQVPSGTELICLLRDAVTGGGYATVGTVIGADLDVIAQAKAPDKLLFRPVTIETALAERALRRRRLSDVTALSLG